MGIGQNVRRVGLKAKNAGTWLTTAIKREKSEPGARDLKKLTIRGVAGGAGLLALYYFGGALLMEEVDDDVNFKPTQTLKQGESAAVAMAVGLKIGRAHV